MRFEYIPKTRAHETFGYIDSPDAFYRFIDDFNIVRVRWAEPTTISTSYFLRVLQEGSSAKAHVSGKNNNKEHDEASIKMNEFYQTLLDHGALWQLKDGRVICTAMPYGNKASIIDNFYQMVKKFNYPDTITLQFLNEKYRFRVNGDYMILIYCNSSQENINPNYSDSELFQKAIQYSGSGILTYKTSGSFIRNQYVSEYAKRRAHGICQLCKQPAPFIDYDGKPFLETHHIIWLADGGDDSIENTVALCPNCHRKMHNLNLDKDVEKLLQIATSYV